MRQHRSAIRDQRARPIRIPYSDASRCGAQAVTFHLLNTGPEGFPLAIVKAHSYNFELAAMYVIVLGYFTVAGAGPWSVDEQVLGGEINFYKKVLGGLDEE